MTLSPERKAEIDKLVEEWQEKKYKEVEYPVESHDGLIFGATDVPKKRAAVAQELGVSDTELEEWLRVTAIQTRWDAIDE